MINRCFLQGQIYWVSLEPVIGTEILKKRPCLIISNNIFNKYFSRVIIVPCSLNIKNIYEPAQFKIVFNDKIMKLLFDQIRSVDKSRLLEYYFSVDNLVLKHFSTNIYPWLFKTS